MKFGHEKNFYYKNPWKCILKKKKKKTHFQKCYKFNLENDCLK